MALPVFEDWGDRIVDWLSAVDEEGMPKRKAQRLARSMRSAAVDLARVKNSVRHENLAVFLEHAAHSLECAELPGARYILMMAHALLYARATASGNRGECGIVLQLPGRNEATTAAVDGVTGIVAG